MSLKTEPPKRPYATLEEYRRTFYSDNNGPVKWPCLECRGYGWIYDPSEQPCSVEGYKMVARLKCQACKGTKEGPRKAVSEAYKAMKKEYARKSREFLRLRKIWGYLRLTEDEIKSLRMFGWPEANKKR